MPTAQSVTDTEVLRAGGVDVVRDGIPILASSRHVAGFRPGRAVEAAMEEHQSAAGCG
ncbi:hypothetical protein GCM10010521_72120 [Streptomyces rameus]|uniref:Uncharacterized protein n=1 Tax=Streptomyces rameus TaxID=68261 RepID=A0ABN3V905_9ACTN